MLKNTPKKHLRGKSHLFAYLCLCAFDRVSLCRLVLFSAFGAFCVFSVIFLCVKCFRKKNKKFKTALITSFILLLNSSYYKHEFFNHYNLFIIIFFNYHNLFQLSQLSQFQLSFQSLYSLQHHPYENILHIYSII